MRRGAEQLLLVLDLRFDARRHVVERGREPVDLFRAVARQAHAALELAGAELARDARQLAQRTHDATRSHAGQRPQHVAGQEQTQEAQPRPRAVAGRRAKQPEHRERHQHRREDREAEAEEDLTLQLARPAKARAPVRPVMRVMEAADAPGQSCSRSQRSRHPRRRSSAAHASLLDQHVAHAAHGADALLRARIVAELGAQMRDVHVDRALADRGVAAPGRGEQRVARHHASGAPRQREQQVELERGQLDLAPADARRAAPPRRSRVRRRAAFALRPRAARGAAPRACARAARAGRTAWAGSRRRRARARPRDRSRRRAR